MKNANTEQAESILSDLLAECGGVWDDGGAATAESIRDAAADPESYGLDSGDLAGAVDGDILALARLRGRLGLRIFC